MILIAYQNATVISQPCKLQIWKYCFYRPNYSRLLDTATTLTMKCPTCKESSERVNYDEYDGNVKQVSFVMAGGDRIHARMVRFVCRRCFLVQEFLVTDEA